MLNEEQAVNLMESLRKDVNRIIAVQNRIKPATDLAFIRERERAVIDRLRKEVDVSRLNSISEDNVVQLRKRIRELVNQDQAPLSTADKGTLLQNVLDEVFGFGPLGPLLRDPTVGDICVNDNKSIYVKRKGRWEKTTAWFNDSKHLMQTIEKILLPIGLRLDESCPMAVARLPNGWTVDAACAPVSVDGPILSIRSSGSAQLSSLGQMIERGTISLPMADLLKEYVRARANIIVSGPARSGKSSLINAFSTYIRPHERVVTIEEASELRLQQEHWIRLQPRPADYEGKDEITMRTLVTKATHMCADRIIVEECRGTEGYELLLAASAGAAGCLTIVTANSLTGCFHRLETMVRFGDPALPLPYARELIADGINVIVQVKRMPDGSHRVSEIVEVRGVDGDKYKLATMFKLECLDAGDGSLPIWHHVAVDTQSQFIDRIEPVASNHEQDTEPRKLHGPRIQSSIDIASEVRTSFGSH